MTHKTHLAKIFIIFITELFSQTLDVAVPGPQLCAEWAATAKDLSWLTGGWTWQCQDHSCVRSEQPLPETLAGSLEVCRLTCGQFGAIWPQPTGLTAISDKVLPIGIDFIWNTNGVKDIDRLASINEFVESNKDRLRHTLLMMCGGDCSVSPPQSQVDVSLSTSSSDLTLGWLTDEHYSLEITPTERVQPNGINVAGVSVSVQAATVYGLRHALQTLSQLITFVAATLQLVIVTHAKAVDKPAYPHRGLLLDTSRHFLPLRALQRTLDAMAAVKLNVLHWHATDSQSFPLSLPSTPQMARYGAYSPSEVYTADDVRMLVKYARLRGVRVVLELDTPAHAGNGWQWGEAAGRGSLAVCVNRQPWRSYCIQPPCGQLNPANPQLYEVLGDIFRDIVDILPQGEAIHMGGDEVFIPCWNSSTEITNWMKSRGMGVKESDFMNIWAEFHQKLLNVWDNTTGNAKTPILLWTSGLTRADNLPQLLDKDRFVIEAWTEASDPLAQRLLALGYRVILATKDAWYLDHGFWGTTQYHNWRKRGVLGGEAALWGELVDESSVDGRAWPRAAAVAERLWADPDTGDAAAAYRLEEVRRRLVAQGVAAEPIMPRWCAQHEGSCVGSVNSS